MQLTTERVYLLFYQWFRRRRRHRRLSLCSDFLTSLYDCRRHRLASLASC